MDTCPHPLILNHKLITVIHFYFDVDLISTTSVQAFFTEVKSLPKFQLRIDECSCLFKVISIPLTLPKFSPCRTGIFSLSRKIVRCRSKSGLVAVAACLHFLLAHSQKASPIAEAFLFLFSAKANKCFHSENVCLRSTAAKVSEVS